MARSRFGRLTRVVERWTPGYVPVYVPNPPHLERPFRVPEDHRGMGPEILHICGFSRRPPPCARVRSRRLRFPPPRPQPADLTASRRASLVWKLAPVSERWAKRTTPPASTTKTDRR